VNGRLLASGFNFAKAVPAGDPAAAYFLDALISCVLGGKSQPSGTVPLEYLRSRPAAGR